MEPEAVESDLLAAIAADPDAIEPRLIYADHLQARSDPRGELIIVQARRLERPEDLELEARERELTAALTKELTDQTTAEPLPPHLIVRWHLGFVDALRLSVRAIRQLRTTHRGWFAQPQFAAVREVDIESKFARNLRFVRDTQLARTVRRLRFGDVAMSIDAPTFASIVAKLPRLTALHLRALDVPALGALAKLPLRELSLELYELTREGIARLCEAPWSLERFGLRTLRTVDEQLVVFLGSVYDGTVMSTVKHYLVDGGVPPMDILETLAASRRALGVETFNADFRRLTYDQQQRAERHREALAKITFTPILGSSQWSDTESLVSVGSFLCYRLARPADAIPLYRHALRRNAQHATARQSLAHALLRTKRFEESVAELDLAISQAAKPSASLFNDRHYPLCELGRREEARADLRRAVELEPTFANAWNNLGCELRYAGDAEGALAAFRRCQQIDPRHAYARRNEADLLLELGLAGEAVPIYRELAGQRSDRFAANMLAYAQFEAGDAAGARATIDARLAAETDRVRLHILRALVLADLGEAAGARADLVAAAETTDCPGWYALAVFARVLGDPTAWPIATAAITPDELAAAFVAHGKETRGARATAMHAPTADDHVDFAEVAIAHALLAKDRALAAARARAAAVYIAAQGPRYFRSWWPTFAACVHVTNRDLDTPSRTLLRTVMRATRGRQPLSDLAALAP